MRRAKREGPFKSIRRLLACESKMDLNTYLKARTHFSFLLSASLCGCCLLMNQKGHAFEWHADKAFRWAELDVPKGGKPGFTLLSQETTGITFTNTLDEATGAGNRVLYGGSGVAVGDFDG